MSIHLHVKVTEDQARALRERQIEVGVTVSEQVRRAINLMLFADKQKAADGSPS